METPMCYYWPSVSWGNRLPHVRGMWWIGARGAPGHIGKPIGDCGGVMSERIDGDICGCPICVGTPSSSKLGTESSRGDDAFVGALGQTGDP